MRQSDTEKDVSLKLVASVETDILIVLEIGTSSTNFIAILL